MEKNTKDPEFYDFIQKSKQIKIKNTKYLVGYYKNNLTMIKQYDYLDAKDRYIKPGTEIKEYDPDDILSSSLTKELDNFLEK